MAGKRLSHTAESYTSAATLLPVIVGALLMMIVAIFIFEAPNQITTRDNSGYLNTEMPVAAAPVPVTNG